jgi:hypothetical protein
MALFSVQTVFSQEYQLTEKDVTEFLGFVGEYKAMASKLIKVDESKGISGIFYSDNKKLLTATTNFLKKKNWTYDKFNQFIYKVTLAIVAYKYYEEYGYPEEVGESDDMEAFKDISPDDIALIKKNASQLEALFPDTENSEVIDDNSSDAMN